MWYLIDEYGDIETFADVDSLRKSVESALESDPSVGVDQFTVIEGVLKRPVLSVSFVDET